MSDLDPEPQTHGSLSRMFLKKLSIAEMKLKKVFEQFNEVVQGNDKDQLYGKVEVVLIRWKKVIVDVDPRIERLAKVFEIQLNFTSRRDLIPSGAGEAFRHVSIVLEALGRGTDTEPQLLIVYYIGHGAEIGGKYLLASNGFTTSSKLMWPDYQAILDKKDADVLYVFDCFYAARNKKDYKSGSGHREFLGVAGKEDTDGCC